MAGRLAHPSALMRQDQAQELGHSSLKAQIEVASGVKLCQVCELFKDGEELRLSRLDQSFFLRLLLDLVFPMITGHAPVFELLNELS